MKKYYIPLFSGLLIFIFVIAVFLLFPFKKLKDKNYIDYKNNIEVALQYCKKNNLNDSFFYLIDLSVPSGKKRMYLINFDKHIIESRYMVSHGCGPYLWGKTFSKNNAMISNEEDSHCSSIGKYFIGDKSYSNWGIKVKYLLHGKESTNSNALKRTIVLHSWNEVSDNEVYPRGTPEGWGCPAVSNNTLKEISEKIDSSDKKVLLWIIKS